MRQIPLTREESGLNNYFAMSEEPKPNQAFIAMFIEMMKTLREAGWTQRRLCAELGYVESWLSKIKHAGQGMDLTVLIRICEVTGIPPEKLLAGYPCPRKAETEADKITRLLKDIPPDDVRRLILNALEDWDKNKQ